MRLLVSLGKELAVEADDLSQLSGDYTAQRENQFL